MKEDNIKYYKLDNILKHDSQYYIIFGSRSSGKSYAVMRYAIDQYFKEGKQFVICKRYDLDLKPRVCETMLVDHYDYVMKNYHAKISFYQGKWLLYSSDLEKRPPISECRIIGYALAINTVERSKGSQYPNVGTIIFEEFMSLRGDYLPNEVNLFMNLISTIARNRRDLKIFMLGNAISKFSPYTDAIGIKLHKLMQGEIKTIIFKNGKSTTKFTIERTRNVIVDNNKPSNISYNVFGTQASKMIERGQFETGNYNKFFGNIGFSENINELELSDRYDAIDIDIDNYLPIIAVFDDVTFYQLLMGGYRNNRIMGFIPVSKKTLDPNETYILLNGKNVMSDFKESVCIMDIMRWNGYGSKMMDRIVDCAMQDRLIFPNDEVGEDVVTILKKVGLIYEPK